MEGKLEYNQARFRGKEKVFKIILDQETKTWDIFREKVETRTF